MKRIAIAFLCVVFLFQCAGCIATREKSIEEIPLKNYKPLNAIQQGFYDVQTLYESGKFKATIELGEDFISKYQRDILTVAIQYYVAVSYQKLGNYSEAERKYKQILETKPDDEWEKLATVGLQEIKNLTAQK